MRLNNFECPVCDNILISLWDVSYVKAGDNPDNYTAAHRFGCEQCQESIYIELDVLKKRANSNEVSLKNVKHRVGE